jgi:hypothetical protein
MFFIRNLKEVYQNKIVLFSPHLVETYHEILIFIAEDK